jgi:hypothetical protein
VLAGRSERRRSQAAGASWSAVPALVVHSRQIPVAGIAQIERICPDQGKARSPALQASLGVNRRRDPPRSTIVRQLASPARGPVVFCMRHGRQAFSSSVGSERGARARTPRRQSVGDASTKVVANACRSPIHRLSTLAAETVFVDGGRAPSSIGPRRDRGRPRASRQRNGAKLGAASLLLTISPRPRDEVGYHRGRLVGARPSGEPKSPGTRDRAAFGAIACSTTRRRASRSDRVIPSAELISAGPMP